MQVEIKVYRAPEGVSLLSLTAPDVADAVRQAEGKGYRVIAARTSGALSGHMGRRRQFSAPLFSQELLSLLEAGLSLVEAVDILSRKGRDAESRRVLESLAQQLREGRSFSMALESLPDAFPALYIATIRSAEQTGDLAEALRRYLAYHC